MKTKALPVLIFSEKPDPLNVLIFWGRCQKRLAYAIKRITPSHFSWILGLFLFTAALPVFAQQFSIWNKTATPLNLAEPDSNSVELGVRFRSTVSGFVTSILFYRGPGNVGTHFGSIWTSDGILLARVEFTDETVADGWQQADFTPPVPISAGQIYVASYFAPFGNYSLDKAFFASTGVASGPLQLLQAGINGGNGVYVYSRLSTFPSKTFNANNYWVDLNYTTANTNTLGDLSCVAGQVAKFNGTRWTCRADSIKANTRFIGEQYGGGKIFYVDDSGQHGLIAALANVKVPTNLHWSTFARDIPTGDGLGAGEMNTAIIVNTINSNSREERNFAAKSAANYSVQADGITACTGSATETCYGDWYLPSKFELNLLYMFRAVVGGFDDSKHFETYWSSTQESAGRGYAWTQSFRTGVQSAHPYKFFRNVRAIRTF